MPINIYMLAKYDEKYKNKYGAVIQREIQYKFLLFRY